jgi:DNA-binding transcriptional LysR family regulator
MDRFESMSVFVVVVSAGSFSGASRRLRMPLATVSRKVSDLESHLGARLLVRSTRGLALTEVGESYFVACKRILEEAAEADRVAAGEYNAPHGELVLTAPVVFGRLHVLPLTAEFLRAHPDVDARLLLTDRRLHLVDDRVDLAARIGTLPDSSLVATRVGQTRSIVCASPAYLEERGVPRAPTALARHDCVTFTALGGTDAWTFRDGEVVRVRSRLVVSTAEAAIDAALAGVGLTRVLSYQAASAVKAGKLSIVLRKFEPAPLPVHLVYVRAPLLSGKLRAFLDFAAPRLRARLAEGAT